MGDDPARYLERESPLGGLPTAAGRPAPRLSQLELSSMPGGGAAPGRAALSPGRRERPWRPGVLRGEGRAEAGRLCLGSAPGCRSLPPALGDRLVAGGEGGGWGCVGLCGAARVEGWGRGRVWGAEWARSRPWLPGQIQSLFALPLPCASGHQSHS